MRDSVLDDCAHQGRYREADFLSLRRLAEPAREHLGPFENLVPSGLQWHSIHQ